MQELSSHRKKTTPKNYQIWPKIYPQIVFPLKKVGFPPTGLREML